MIKISQIVKEIIETDIIAKEALQAGLLNLSAYARKIRPNIESRLFKPVKKGSIIIALSRLEKETKPNSVYLPDVKIDNINIKSPLHELTYDKNEDTVKKAGLLKSQLFNKKEVFFTITQGVNEITIVTSQNNSYLLKKHFEVKPKGEYSNLAAVTINFNESEYIEVPNMIFTIISALASQRINIIEIISTFTEISFIIRISEMQKTVGVFNQFLRT